MGVKLVNLDAGDKLQAIAPVISEDKEDRPEAGFGLNSGVFLGIKCLVDAQCICANVKTEVCACLSV